MSELEQVKTLIGISFTNTAEDSLFDLLLERAGNIIDGIAKVEGSYDYLKIDAVVFAYNLRGAEGTRRTTSGDFSQSWYYDTMVNFIRANMPAQYVIK